MTIIRPVFWQGTPPPRQDCHIGILTLVLAGNFDQKPGLKRQEKVNTFRRHRVEPEGDRGTETWGFRLGLLLC